MAKTAKCIISLICIIYFAKINETHAVQVEGMRLWRATDSTRLVLDLNSPARHSLSILTGPDRIVIDIPKSTVKQILPAHKLKNTPIKQIRTGIQANGNLRLVLDLKQKVRSKSFFLSKRANRQDRIVIDLADIENSINTSALTVTDTNLKPIQKSMPKISRDILIAIDAGHGGDDPGAIGPRKTYEKDIVLSIAQTLKHLIDQEAGFHAELIRKRDRFISLQSRRDAVHAMKADLLLSIHADAFDDPSVYGASIYTLSKAGTSSSTIKKRTHKESRFYRETNTTLKNYSSNVTANRDHSIQAGQFILTRLGKVTKLHKKKVEHGEFAILRSMNTPSLLIETGFISNPGEAQRFSTRAHRTKLATAIYAGVRDYFLTYPPPKTYVAQDKKQKNSRQYVISYGETLSEIAMRHKVSMTKIMKLNGLNGTKIQVGQKLTIPTS